jgi:hypothetical protein
LSSFYNLCLLFPSFFISHPTHFPSALSLPYLFPFLDLFTQTIL